MAVTTISQNVKPQSNESLFQRFHSGDFNARDDLVTNNIGLVKKIAYKFSSFGEDPDDLFQIGCIGLMNAINHYDPSKNVKFNTYATPTIVGNIMNYLRDNRLVRVSRDIQNMIKDINNFKKTYIREHNREPNDQEVMNALNLDPIDFSLAVSSKQDPLSLHQSSNSSNEDASDYIDIIATKDDNSFTFIELKMSVDSLDPLERDIIIKRFIEDKTQKAVAQELRISQAQVSRLETKALLSLKEVV